MKKLLLLEFKGAGFFKRADKDYVILSNTVRAKRIDVGKRFLEPLTYHQVSNMLHVLFGERPCSTLRNTIYQRIPYYDDMAMNTLLKITTPEIESEKKNYGEEAIILNKAIWRSWNPNPHITWEVIRRYLAEDFQWFLSEIEREFGVDPFSLTFNECKERIRDTPLFNVILIDELGKRKKGGLSAYLKNDSSASEITRTIGRIVYHTVKGIADICRISGKLLVPIDNDDIDKLNYSTGVATLLDGGVVYIIGIYNADEISDEGYVKMSEISDEQISFEK